MRILVVGAGAIGTLLAVRLARSGGEVRVAVRGDSVDRLARDGLRVEGPRPDDARVDVVDSAGPLGASDATLVAVKGYDLEAAARSIGRRPGVPTLLIQNGLDLIPRVEAGLRAVGTDPSGVPIVRGVLTLPVTLLGPGRVRETGVGWVVLPSDGPGPLREPVRLWAGLLAGAGLEVRRVPDFEREVWRKLLVNAAINPVTAMHGVENGRLAQEPWRGQALQLLEEARQVAAAEGFEFPREEAERELFEVVRATAANRSSMLQDVDRGRPTEIGTISGAVLKRGRRHGLDLPGTRRVVDRLSRPVAGAGAPTRAPERP